MIQGIVCISHTIPFFVFLHPQKYNLRMGMFMETEKKCIVIAITNQKGGVGKTTTATALSIAASELFGKKVLLIDTDPQGNSTKQFAGNTIKSGSDLVNYIIHYDQDKINDEQITLSHLLMRKVTDVNKAIIHTKYLNLDFIGTDLNLNIAKKYISSSAKYIKTIIEPLKNEYDLIVFDCAPSTDNILYNVLNAVDCCYIPIQPEIQSIDGLMQTVVFANQVFDLDNPTLNFKVVITMFDSRLKHHREFQENLFKLNDNVDAHIFNHIPGNHIVFNKVRKQSAWIDRSNSFANQKHFILQEGSKKPLVTDEYIGLVKQILGGDL